MYLDNEDAEYDSMDDGSLENDAANMDSVPNSDVDEDLDGVRESSEEDIRSPTGHEYPTEQRNQSNGTEYPDVSELSQSQQNMAMQNSRKREPSGYASNRVDNEGPHHVPARDLGREIAEDDDSTAGQVLVLASSGNSAALREALLKLVGTTTLLEGISSRVAEGDLEPILRAILTALDSGGTLRHVIYNHIFELIAMDNLTGRQAEKVVSVLHEDLAKCSSSVLQETVQMVMEHLQGGIRETLELLPKCLVLIVDRPDMLSEATGEVDDCDTETTKQLSGAEFRDQVVHQICALPEWKPSTLVLLVKALREAPLTNPLLEKLVLVAFKHCRKAKMDDLPVLCYQLLLLSTRGQKRLIMKSLVEMLEWFEHAVRKKSSTGLGQLQRSINQLRQEQGTVILHIDFVVKQDPELGQAWLRYLKSEQPALGSFSVAVLLALARTQRFEQPALNVIKDTLLKKFRDEKRCAESRWASKVSDLETMKQVHSGVEEAVLSMVRDAATSWDHIVPSLVQLGVTLLGCTPTTPFGGFNSAASVYKCPPYGDAAETLEAAATPKSPPARRAAALGLCLLREAFQVHKTSRDAIIEAVVGHVVTSKGNQCAHFLRLIVLLARDNPHVMLDYTPRLKEALEYITFLSPGPAVGLLLALRPLCRAQTEMNDYIVVLLRKAMLQREVAPRLIAVRGYLHLVLNEGAWGSNTESMHSEASCSQMHGLGMGKHGQGLMREVMGFLRRCLTQQAEVRAALYHGVYGILLNNPTSQDAVFNLLLPHFRRFYELDEGLAAPLKLEACLLLTRDNFRLVEPLHLLLFTIHRLMALQPPDADRRTSTGAATTLSDSIPPQASCQLLPSGSSAAQVMASYFAALRNRILTCNLEDFELDKSSDFDPASPQGARNQELACLLLGIFEVLVETQMDELETSLQGRRCDDSVIDNLQTLLQLHYRLTALLSDKKAVLNPRKKQKTAGNLQAAPSSQAGVAGTGQLSRPYAIRPPLMTPRCLASLLREVVGGDNLRPSRQCGHRPQDSCSKHHPAFASLAAETHFQEFVMHNCFRWLYTAAQPSESTWLQAVVGGNEHDEENVKSMMADSFGDWIVLGPPLIRAVELFVHTLAAGGFRKDLAGLKKQESLALKAIKCFELLVKLASPDQLSNILSEVLPRAVHRPAQVDHAGAVDDDTTLEDESDEEDLRLTMVHGKQSPDTSIHARMPHFERLVQRLVDTGHYKEAEILSGVTMSMASSLPSSLAVSHSNWARQLCGQSKIEHTPLVKVVVGISLSLQVHPLDLETADMFVQEILEVLGDENNEARDWSETVKVVGEKTACAVVSVVLKHLDGVVEDVAWVLASMRSLSGSSRVPLEDLIFGRMEALARTMATLLRIQNFDRVVSESILKLAIRLYHVLALAARGCLAPKGVKQAIVSRQFQALVVTVSQKLTPNIYEFIRLLQQADDIDMDNDQGDMRKKSSTAKIKREGRNIPNLVFQVEDYEKYLILLSKSTGINLLAGAKRSTARDFKLSIPKHHAPQNSMRNSGLPQAHQVLDPGASILGERGCTQLPKEAREEDIGEEEEEEEEEEEAEAEDIIV